MLCEVGLSCVAILAPASGVADGLLLSLHEHVVLFVAASMAKGQKRRLSLEALHGAVEHNTSTNVPWTSRAVLLADGRNSHTPAAIASLYSHIGLRSLSPLDASFIAFLTLRSPLLVPTAEAAAWIAEVLNTPNPLYGEVWSWEHACRITHSHSI